MFPPRPREPEVLQPVEDLPEEEQEEAEEIIKEDAERAGVTEATNIYYNKIKRKQEELIECIETTGAVNKAGKPYGFRRA